MHLKQGAYSRYIRPAVIGFLVFTSLLLAVPNIVSSIARSPSMFVKIPHANISLISSVRGISVFPIQLYGNRMRSRFELLGEIGGAAWMKCIAYSEEIIFPCWKDCLGSGNWLNLFVRGIVPRDFNPAAPLEFQSRRFSEISVVRSYSYDVRRRPWFKVCIGESSDRTRIGNPNVGALVNAKTFAGIVDLLSKITNSKYTNYRESKSQNHNPPIRVSGPIRNPARGWIMCGFGVLSWCFGLWYCLFFAGYQFHVKRIAWGITSLLFGMLAMVLGIALIGHGISLTLRPAPWL
jgi:hypothetical protein